MGTNMNFCREHQCRKELCHAQYGEHSDQFSNVGSSTFANTPTIRAPGDDRWTTQASWVFSVISILCFCATLGFWMSMLTYYLLRK